MRCDKHSGFLLRAALAAVLFTLAVLSTAMGQTMGVVPINEAEGIIEPFWEPALSGLAQWSIGDGMRWGLEVTQTWASVEFYWAAAPEAEPALSMTRAFDVDCSAYDRLLVAVVLPEGATLRIAAVTDAGEREFESAPAPKEIVEHALDLAGARRLVSLTLDITPGAPGQAAGWFKWIGLQDTAMLPRYLARWDFSKIQWDAYLQDESYEPAFTPRYGIFLTQEELDVLRARHETDLAQRGTSAYSAKAPALRALEPERGIAEFARSGGRRNEQHGRVRDASMPTLDGGPEAARAGLVLKDKGLLRVAARYALSVALSDKWDEGFVARFPGSAWELRSFRRSYCTQDVAEVLDLAGEMFTEAGRIYVMRRLAEEGVGPVNFITWRFDYLFECNQMAFVTRGRLGACLVMEREWPHVRPYTDIAYDNLCEVFDNVILPDGGLLEPPTYVGATLGRGCEMLDLYARGRGLDVREVLPAALGRTGDYAAVIASTCPGADVIPYGDSDLDYRSGTLLSLAYLAPKSCWTTMLHKCLDREQRTSFTPEEQHMLDAIPERDPRAPAFVFLPDVGHMASMRRVRSPRGGDMPVKLLILGNRGAEPHSHEHEDRGSFVLEFGGEVYAMDPGVCDYEDPLHALLKQCQYHNMLVPFGTDERPRPRQPILADVKPVGKGNRKSFHAVLDAVPGWREYYTRWRRTWDSPAPHLMTVTDAYELKKGDGVESYWQTALPCHLDGQRAIIEGARGRGILEAPPDCILRIDDLPGPENGTLHRIAVRQSGTSGVLQVNLRLEAK